jgi:hypothetical protein
MAHDNYHDFYTWNGGTLVLDPGVFAWDEPHLRMCNRVPVHATGLDRVFDPFEEQFCAKPMRLMSSKHRQLPIAAAARCDTMVPGRSYCCPPYVMPSDWRVDYLPLGNDAEAAAQQIAEGAAEMAEGAIQEAGVIIEDVERRPEVRDVTTRLRDAVRQKPLTYLGMGVLTGVILTKLFGRRGR